MIGKFVGSLGSMTNRWAGWIGGLDDRQMEWMVDRSVDCKADEMDGQMDQWTG